MSNFVGVSSLNGNRSRAVLSGCLIAILVPIALIGAFNLGLFSSVAAQPTVSFSSAVNLSADTYQAQYPWVSSSGSYVYVAWTEEAHGIYIRVSNNSGATWTPPTTKPATRLSLTGGTTTYPVMATNGSNVYVIWSQSLVSGGNGEIFVATSNNYGASFSAPVELTINMTTYTSDTGYVAAYGSDVYVIWHAVSTSNSAESVWVSSSSNAGQKWSTAIQLDAKSGQADEPQIAAWGTYAYATWDRNGAWFSYTSNNGLTWSVSAPVNLNPGSKSVPAGTVREPWIAASGTNVYVTWNDNSGYGTTNGAIYDPYIMVSNNNGKTWNQNYAVKGVKLNLMPSSTSSWEIQDTAVGNNVYVVWRDHTPAYTTNGDDLMMMSANAGLTWTPSLGTQTPMDVSNDNQITGWSNGVGVSGSTVALAYMSDCSTGEQEPSPNSGPGDCGMFVSYSNNGGASFYPEVNVSNDRTSGPITDVSSSNFAVSGSYVFVTWQDQAASKFQVYFSSTNGTIVQPTTFSITPVRGATGTVVTVTGNNFASSSLITIKFDSSTLTTVTSNSSGGFSVSVTVPSSVAGSHSISASDGTNSASKNFNVVPNIALSPVKGATTTTVTVTGTGFAASSPVSVTFGSAGQQATATTDVNGSFAANFNIPSVPAGTSVVTATDGSSNSATANFNVVSKITLSPVKGPTQTSVIVTGTGFAANSPVTVAFDATTEPNATTNASGSFTSTFNVPTTVGGNHVVTATDWLSNSATVNYNLVSTLSLSPVKGATGKTVLLTGTGFASDSNISITYDGILLSTTPSTVTSNINGSFSASVNIPLSTAGKHTISTTDGINTASGSYTVVPSISISPKNIPHTKSTPTTITVTGSGFAADSVVTISFGGSIVTTTPSTVTTDSNGNVVATFTIQSGIITGSYSVLVNDGSGNSASATFNVN